MRPPRLCFLLLFIIAGLLPVSAALVRLIRKFQPDRPIVVVGDFHASAKPALDLLGANGLTDLSIRSESARNRRALAWSADGATGWSIPAFHDTLLEPVCMAGLIAIAPTTPPDGALLVFSHPASLERIPSAPAGSTSRRRENLTLRTSRDGGETWPGPTSGPSAE